MARKWTRDKSPRPVENICISSNSGRIAALCNESRPNCYRLMVGRGICRLLQSKRASNRVREHSWRADPRNQSRLAADQEFLKQRIDNGREDGPDNTRTPPNSNNPELMGMTTILVLIGGIPKTPRIRFGEHNGCGHSKLVSEVVLPCQLLREES